MRFTVEPSPAGGFHVRVVGADAPLSHHDTEEEADARRLAYERGASGGEIVDLPDGSDVLIRADDEALQAIDPRTGANIGLARYVRDRDRPSSAEAAVAVVDAWQGRGLGGALLKRLSRRASANGIDTFTTSLLTGNRNMLRLFERLGAVRTRGQDGGVLEIDVELPVDDAAMLLRNAATGYVRSRD